VITPFLLAQSKPGKLAPATFRSPADGSEQKTLLYTPPGDAPVLLTKDKLDVPLDINTGIHDGHTGSVPVSHALRAFNVVASPPDRIAEATIADMVTNRAVPAPLRFSGTDRLNAARPVLMRRVSERARITIFDGGHEILHEAALSGLEAQAKEARLRGAGQERGGGKNGRDVKQTGARASCRRARADRSR
jgi:hypothetical protein